MKSASFLRGVYLCFIGVLSTLSMLHFFRLGSCSPGPGCAIGMGLWLMMLTVLLIAVMLGAMRLKERKRRIAVAVLIGIVAAYAFAFTFVRESTWGSEKGPDIRDVYPEWRIIP